MHLRSLDQVTFIGYCIARNSMIYTDSPGKVVFWMYNGMGIMPG